MDMRPTAHQQELVDRAYKLAVDRFAPRAAKSDREAIRLLRRHGILSMATWVAGFEDETLRDLWRDFRQLIAYDPDLEYTRNHTHVFYTKEAEKDHSTEKKDHVWVPIVKCLKMIEKGVIRAS